MEVKFLNAPKKFLGTLESHTYGKVLRIVTLLEKFGSELRMPYSKQLGPGLLELRVRGQQEVRLLYTFRENSVIILHGFIKKSQRTPAHELKIAQIRRDKLDAI